jgi:hypothetical protein
MSQVYLFKFDFQKSKWSSFMLELPENHTHGNIHTILACAGKLYAIMSCHMYFIQISGEVFQQWSTFLMEVKEDVSKFDIKYYLFQRNERTDVEACTMQDSKICILANRVGENPESVELSTKFLVFDTATNKKYDHSKGAHWDTLMIPVGDEIVVTSMGQSSCTRFSLATRKWTHTEEQFLPFPTQSFESTEYTSTSDDNNFYLFGRSNQSLESPSETWCYNFGEKKWKELPALPQPLRQSATCLVQLPSHLSKCHIKCPHCRFSRRRVSYDIHDLSEILDKKKTWGKIIPPFMLD